MTHPTHHNPTCSDSDTRRASRIRSGVRSGWNPQPEPPMPSPDYTGVLTDVTVRGY